jgi:hypothetical protein
VVDQQDGDPAAIASLDYTATLHWTGRKVASGLTAATERGTVNRFLTALRSGATSTAGALAAPGVAAEAANQFSFYPEPLAATPICYGLNSYKLSTTAALTMSPTMEGAERICLLPINSSGEKYVALGLDHSGFHRWEITAIAVI